MKKRIFVILILIICLISVFTVSRAKNETYMIDIKVKNTNNEEYSLLVLLPLEYIDEISSGNIEDGDYVSFLKNEDLEELNIDKNNIEDNTYKENNKEYVQIKLEPVENNYYQFEAVQNEQNENIKFRITSDTQDYIIHLNDFKIQDNVCKITYDYQEKVSENIQKIEWSIFSWKFAIIIAIIAFVIYIIYRINKKE